MIGRGLAVLYNLEVMFDELYVSVKLPTKVGGSHKFV
jgi:hypothetical protein